MIDRAIGSAKSRIKSLGSESVHGLPLDWPERKKGPKRTQGRNDRRLLGTQNVHGLPTDWNELDLSE